MNSIGGNKLIADMHQLAQNSRLSGKNNNENGDNGFDSLLKNSLDKVNDLQKQAEEISVSYQKGDDVSVAELMISQQKASVSLSGALSVRNKLVQAYQDIMNMQV